MNFFESSENESETFDFRLKIIKSLKIRVVIS